MNERQVHVRKRPEPQPGENASCWNLFARLSPSFANALYQAALDSVIEKDQAGLQGWAVSAETPSEFLPLCIENSNGETIYVSYNGGDIVSGDEIVEEDTIELPASLVADSETHVFVKPLAFVQDAVSLEVEPLSVEDWELFEIHADFLEGGGLLGQVSVVYPGQILTLCVSSQDIAQVRVVEGQHDGASYLRLLADTEVVVRPKPRQSSTTPTMSIPLRVFPTREDYSPAMQELAQSEQIQLVRVPPCALHLHPDDLTLCQLKEESVVRVWLSKRDEATTPESTSGLVLARVETNTAIPIGHVGIHYLLRYQLNASPLFDFVRIERFDLLEDDSVYVRQLVEAGTLRISVEPAALLDWQGDTSSPWAYAGMISEIFQPSQIKSLNTGSSSAFDCRELSERVALWLNLYDAGSSKMPLACGSIITLSSDTSSNKALYKLLVRNSPDGEISESHRALLGKEVPSLILNSSSDTGSAPVHYLHPSHQDHMLNMLPSVVNSVGSNLSSLLLEDPLSRYDGVLLRGEVGSGKTHTALLIAARMRLGNAHATLYLDCNKLQSSPNIRMKDTLDELSKMFEEAVDARPCVLILDDLDELIPNLESESGEESSAQQQQPNPVAVSQSKLIADHLQNLIATSLGDTIGSSIFLVITCRDPACLVDSIQPANVFLYSRQVPLASISEREELFSSMLKHKFDSMSSCGDALQEFHMPGFGSKTEGFRPTDLDVLATRVHHSFQMASLEALDDASISSNLKSHVLHALENFTPISRQDIGLETTPSVASWGQVGGLFSTKEQLTASILRPIRYARIYQHAPIRLPRGILLYGPPGCGKSYLVPALAKECGLTLVTCRGPELLDKYIGASEANVRQLFQRAYSAAPSLLFLDEFDALAPRRGSDHTGVTDRVVNQLLTFLDGVEVETGKQVYIVAATSRPDKVDVALLRPGRLERHLFVGFPEEASEWNDVLSKILADRNVDQAVRGRVESGELLKRLLSTAPQVHLFSPADLKAAVNTAHLQAVHEFISLHDVSEETSTSVKIEWNHLVESLKSTRPSLSTDDRNMLSRIYLPFRGKEIEDMSKNETRDSKLMTAFR